MDQIASGGGMRGGGGGRPGGPGRVSAADARAQKAANADAPKIPDLFRRIRSLSSRIGGRSS